MKIYKRNQKIKHYNVKEDNPNFYKYKYNITKKYLFNEYIINKKSIRQIAKEIGCNYPTIRRRLIKYNIQIRTLNEADSLKDKLKISKKFLIQEYITNKKSTIKIAEKLGCDTVTVRDRLIKFNIPIRTISEANKGIGRNRGKNNPSYGKITHSKGNYYKNIWMRSSWELLFAQFLDLSRYKWLYEPKIFDLGNTTYTPDFYIPEWDLYIEIKGWWRDGAKRKFILFKRLYPKVKINVLMQRDLQKLGVLK